MSLSATQISHLKTLLQGKPLAWSALNDSVRKTLVSEELVTIQSHGSYKTVCAVSIEVLRQFLEQHFEELRGFDWNGEEFPATTTRAGLAVHSGNSKTRVIRSCPGFMVNSFSPIPAHIGAEEILISPVAGSMLFIADWELFSIPKDVLIIGIENMENFRNIRKQKYLFPTDSQILFVARYPQNGDLIRWLKSIPNPYLHFGDFDLAGMHIFETEFYIHLRERSSFLIPEDIEIRIQKGSAERYNSQYERLKQYIPSDKRLLPLYNLIQKYHRCYDQEGYIGNE
ncbi:MAG: hypothetical protein MJZ91_04490 [Bacteroidales bacterium]|nr:hypothetical protein [Bacteroidales bacterium]